jgi:serine/threonine protein kinase
MGEVYKARDTRLDRTVAIKFSTMRFSERFGKEARAISSLNHPHICTLYDVGPDYLVMEFVEGETLARRIEKTRLPMASVLHSGAQIADALDAAHAKGIIHRDLKPANIMIARSGVKVLDFGLAKSASRCNSDATQAETVTASEVIVGTPPYMAPEQLAGKECDARSDIFALGIVLYEMAAGKRPFAGANRAELAADIMRSHAPPLVGVPRQFAHIVEQCLAKDPADRWQSAHDLAIELRWMEQASAAAPMPISRKGMWAGWLIAATLLVMAFLFRNSYLSRATSVPARVEFSLPLPADALSPSSRGSPSRGSPLAISPDGNQLALRAVGQDGRDYLWVRPIASSNARLLPGTAGTESFFWAPDSRYVAFFSAGKLRKVDIRGGAAVDLCDVAGVFTGGGAWNSNGSIIFTSDSSAETWYRVSSQGGPVERLPAFPKGVQPFPQFLPDGRHFIASGRGSAAISGVYLGLLGKSDIKLLVRNATNGSYTRASGTSEGYLLFTRNDLLMAQRFDLDRQEVSGEPFLVTSTAFGFSTSDNGVVVYNNILGRRRLTWVDREGRLLASLPEVGDYRQMSLSPDESTLAVSRVDGPNSSLWLMDLSRGATNRLTSDRTNHWYPVWSPDGRRIAYGMWDTEKPNLRAIPSSGSGPDEPLLPSPATTNVSSWSADGRYLAYWVADPTTQYDIWVLPVQERGSPFLFLQTNYNELQPAFSPDGRWIAYTSDESGRQEVYVRAFAGGPATTGARRISIDGGSLPRWRRDGRELFYLSPGRKLMSAEFDGATALVRGVPRSLFQTKVRMADYLVGYAVAGSGKKFLLSAPTEDPESSLFTVIVNWNPSEGGNTSQVK